jgi:hypothetical protein
VTVILAGFYARQSLVTPLKRACVDRADQLPDGQLGSSAETGFSEMFKPKLSHHRGSLNRVLVDQSVVEMNPLSTQFNGYSVAPAHPKISVLGPNGPRLKVKAVQEVIVSTSHREGCIRYTNVKIPWCRFGASCPTWLSFLLHSRNRPCLLSVLRGQP